MSKSKKLVSRALVVPILTDEYFVDVLFGDREAVVHAGAKLCGDTVDWFRNEFEGKRGMACNLLKKQRPRSPLIVLDSSLPWPVALATLAHEASHCMDYIASYIGIDDRSGEFHAHGIGAVMRSVGKEIAKKQKKD